jgi:hypothetical protein
MSKRIQYQQITDNVKRKFVKAPKIKSTNRDVLMNEWQSLESPTSPEIKRPEIKSYDILRHYIDAKIKSELAKLECENSLHTL